MRSTKRLIMCATAALTAAGSAALAQPAPSGPAAMPQAEISDIATMPPATPRWFYVLGGYGQQGARIFDADTAKMKGLIEVPSLGNLGFDPKGRYYYVAETIWSKISRGVRQDMVTIYDASSLKILTEVPVPGRLLGGTQLSNFTVSTDGKLGYVYALAPSSSVHVVDLEKRKFLQTVQLPGCAALFPSGASDASALCADGSLATISVKGGKGVVSHTAPFFSPADDPVFDIVEVDRAKNTATFVSYTGKIYTATLGESPQFSAPWSMQVAAGMREPKNAPLEVDWLPGGREPFALNRVTGRLYVLMHMGEQWSHKEGGEEIWVVDLASHKIIARHKAPAKIANIQVSQEAKPLIYVTAPDGKLMILDEDASDTKRSVERAGGVILVSDPA
jgi:methylamine dehydrogenase heavy chain